MKKIISILTIGVLVFSAIVSAVLPVTIGITTDKNCDQIRNLFKIFSNNDPEEEWNLTFGTEKFDAFFGVEQTDDGGFIAFGTTNGHGYYNGGDFYLVKITGDGEIEWIRIFGGSKTDFGSTVKETNDGGYILLGSTASYGSGQWDIWVLKTNENGLEEWNSTFGGYNFEQSGHSIVETSDNCFIVTGLTYSFSADSSMDALLLKIDENGNEIWNKTYGLENDEHFWDVEITSDDGYILTGFSKNRTTHNAWVVKTDSNGNMLWDKKFGPANQALDIIESDDGGYVFVCEAEQTSFGGYLNSWLIKIDNMGNKEWDKLFITPKGEDNFAVHHHILNHKAGGYILTGLTNGVKPVYSVGDLWLTRVDDYGNVLWEKILGGAAYDSTYKLDITDDDGYIIAGATESYGEGDFDAWLVKIANFENQRPNKPTKPSGPAKGKPNTEYTFTTSTTDPDGDQVAYMWDWGDGNYSEWLNTAEASYTWTEEDNYNIRVIAKDINGGESDWSDPLSFSTPKNKQVINPLFLQILENHPYMFPILRQLLALE